MGAIRLVAANESFGRDDLSEDFDPLALTLIETLPGIVPLALYALR
jgi:hypothetical protein